MDDKKLDKEIKESIINNTQESLDLKNEMWSNIENRLNSENQVKEISRRRNNMKKKRNNNRRLIVQIGASAAAIILFVSAVATEPGQAALRRVKEYLDPEKTITEELEGQQEDADVTLKESKLGYSIYFDEERYTLEKVDGADRIVPILGENASYLPEVFMEIKHIKDGDRDSLALEIEERLREEFKEVELVGEVESPIVGISMFAYDGHNWDSTSVKYYIVDDNHGGVFIIYQKLFIEASEGHGVRFDNMLKEFRIELEQ